MPGPEQWLAFALAALLVVGVPGPATLFVLAQARHSRARAHAAVLGLVLGDLVWMTASALGLGVLLQQWPGLASGLRWVGAAYLVRMAWGLWCAPPGPSARQAAPAQGLQGALLITLCNPKPVLFFAAFFPLFLGPEAGAASFVLLGLVFELINVGWFVLLLGGLGRLRQLLPWSERALQRGAAAGLLLSAGLALWA